jgi:hypothetical protein
MLSTNTRNACIAFCFATCVVVPVLLAPIIWFDKYGTDNKRTFINMLNTSLCWMIIEYCAAVQLTEAVRFLYGPFSKSFCFLKTIVCSAYVTETLLYFDAIAMTRYLFIFWLKNPAAFQDDFWNVFVKLWINGASLIFNGVWFLKAERQIINYYVCSGIDPREDFKKPVNIYSVTEISSLVLNIAIYIRIKIYKRADSSRLAENVSLKIYLTCLQLEIRWIEMAWSLICNEKPIVLFERHCHAT